MIQTLSLALVKGSRSYTTDFTELVREQQS